LSGRRPETTRIYDNNTAPRTYLGNAVFLPEYYRSQGYSTARVGKIAHGTYEHQLRWDISESRAGVPIAQDGALQDETPHSTAPPNKPRRPLGKTRPPKRPRRCRRRRGDEGALKLSWTPTDRADADEPDGATARRIAQILRESKDKPFFVGCGFHKPHLPGSRPENTSTCIRSIGSSCPTRRRRSRRHSAHRAHQHQGDDEMTDEQRRQAILAYHAATSSWTRKSAWCWTPWTS